MQTVTIHTNTFLSHPLGDVWAGFLAKINTQSLPISAFMLESYLICCVRVNNKNQFISKESLLLFLLKNHTLVKRISPLFTSVCCYVNSLPLFSFCKNPFRSATASTQEIKQAHQGVEHPPQETELPLRGMNASFQGVELPALEMKLPLQEFLLSLRGLKQPFHEAKRLLQGAMLLFCERNHSSLFRKSVTQRGLQLLKHY